MKTNALNAVPVCLYDKDAIAINNLLDEVLCSKKVDFSDDELRAILSPLRRAIKNQMQLEHVEMQDVVYKNEDFYCPYCGEKMDGFSLMTNYRACDNCHQFYTTNACWERL